MTTTAAIEGKMGAYKYYQTTMKTSDVISKTSAAVDYFSPLDWEEMGEIARVQREPDTKRIMNEIAPYLIRSQKRFFNSIVVLLDEKNCDFKSLEMFPVTDGSGKQTTASKLLLPAYQKKAQSIGFLEINDIPKGMLILDGQHRMLALKKVMNEQNELRETFKKLNENFDDYKDHNVGNDDISVIFLKVPGLPEMRKLFEDLNTYAKRQSKDVEIFGSESNPWYKICQHFCLHTVNKKIDSKFLDHFVQKKGTSLSESAKKMTTAAHLVQIIKFLTEKMHFKQQMQLDAIEEKLNVASKLCRDELNEYFEKIDIFKKIISGKDNSIIPDLRDTSNKDALLLKPMPQVALFKAIYFLKKNSDMDIDAIYKGANKIDYSYDKTGNQWKDLVIASGGNIITSGKVEKLLSDILVYFIAGKSKCLKLQNGQEFLDKLLKNYKLQLDDKENKITELPNPNHK
jgi:DNA sulfur modification protein DndB